jgi:predicted DNA-binding transcriptional regulator AlpA
MSRSIEADDRQPTLLTVPEVLHEARISKAFFFKLTRSGQGPTLTRTGDRVFASRANLAAWLAQHEVRPEARAT